MWVKKIMHFIDNNIKTLFLHYKKFVESRKPIKQGVTEKPYE